jgi:hypothetical protein
MLSFINDHIIIRLGSRKSLARYTTGNILHPQALFRKMTNTIPKEQSCSPSSPAYRTRCVLCSVLERNKEIERYRVHEIEREREGFAPPNPLLKERFGVSPHLLAPTPFVCFIS